MVNGWEINSTVLAYYCIFRTSSLFSSPSLYELTLIIFGYASGDAFTGVWTHGYKVDGQYSFADPNAEYTTDNVILIPQALTAKNGNGSGEDGR